ncbi:tudor and KH domain-containing protein [Nephila pilipes]|uniref:Tudor and KH domain-containing protein n=1 Tax=Nephila pilipes TaxID=299642 RepID=A0A8X6NHW6_NEPPI|nr:tudor and KH domain-containing protein [Nephila pilipes]
MVVELKVSSEQSVPIAQQSLRLNRPDSNFWKQVPVCFVTTASLSTVYLRINGIFGKACADTGSSHSIAGETLYTLLKDEGAKFRNGTMCNSLADGQRSTEDVLITTVTLEIEGRKFDQELIALSNAKRNRTLLGINFLKKSGIMLDLRNQQWFFADMPQKQFAFGEHANNQHPVDNLDVNLCTLREEEVPDNEYSIASVSGTPDSVEDAIIFINEILSNRHEVLTKEIILHEDITDTVWKNVNIIRQICDFTNAKILFDFHAPKNESSGVKITVRGKKEEVDEALELIDEIVAKYEVKKSKQIHVAGRALPENIPGHSTILDQQNLPVEKLIPNSFDGYMEIYVSAVENPNKFWVQIAGSKTVQLDKLATEMTEFYNDSKNKERFQLNSFCAGDIVAAFFAADSSFYRAKVIEVCEENNEQKVKVFYLDFGDCATLNPDLVSLLKPDFLSIPFQAILCSLADVKPINGDWTKEAVQEFEKLVYSAEWKIVMAKLINNLAQNGENSKENFVQSVQILDTSTERDLNISEELVSCGYAIFV